VFVANLPLGVHWQELKDHMRGQQQTLSVLHVHIINDRHGSNFVTCLICTRLWICACVHTHTLKNTHTITSVCVCSPNCTHAHTHTHTFVVCVYLCTCLCMCVYVSVFLLKRRAHLPVCDLYRDLKGMCHRRVSKSN